jgi:transposase
MILLRTSIYFCGRSGVYKEGHQRRTTAMVTDSGQINTTYRLHHEEKWSVGRIARELHIARKTVRKYPRVPAGVLINRKPWKTKLDAFKPLIREFVERDRKASATVIAERLWPLGFMGELTILRNHLRALRDIVRVPGAFIRVESSPGHHFEVDWGHFGSLDYQGDKRKPYAFCPIECLSRRLYVEFTHSQSFETFVRCHIHAFRFRNEVARVCLYDNLWTAATERDGRIVRFNPRFLAFAREFGFYPRAFNPAAAWKKGKIERGGVGYLRQNFWPLRTFSDLNDVNQQVRQWLDAGANKRIHSLTRERPDERFRAEALRPLPALYPDYRDSVVARVHKDMRLCFEANYYCVPPAYVGRVLVIKADSSSVTI